MDTASQDIKQFMFQASGGKDIDAVNNVKLKLRKYMKSFAKAGYKGENPKNALYNLAKEQVKTRRKISRIRS
jgi:hypothetical protein